MRRSTGCDFTHTHALFFPPTRILKRRIPGSKPMRGRVGVGLWKTWGISMDSEGPRQKPEPSRFQANLVQKYRIKCILYLM